MTTNETFIWTVVCIIMIIWGTYKLTKIGMIDDAINFFKYEILKIKRP